MSPIPGAIWLDQPDAHEKIAAKRKADAITDAEAEQLARFADDGYFLIKTDLTAEDAQRFLSDVDRLWEERPENVSVAYDTAPKRFRDANAEHDRKPKYRIHDLHSYSEVARRLYLDKQIHRWMELILDEQPVATQSLFFEYGSQQPLHRDSIVVPTPLFGHLAAVWIALEDIDPRSGALLYVPRSHKMPFYEFAPNQYVFDYEHMGAGDVEKAMRFHDETMATLKLETKTFAPKRGEAFLWHSALMHGGGAVEDERLTRRSFVIHYSSRRTHPRRQAAVLRADGTTEVWTTEEVLRGDGAIGFANPLDGRLEYTR
ncbi:MAG: phytanoyl-CoA dioxygenase family protein [Acidobacteria bacterium]|nr:phytanoyl-CoA dioxygenase family protein [Acidobacteriota bacterium]